MKRGVAAALILGVALAVGLLSALGCGKTAHPILYVSEAGEDSGDCADPASPCRTIQRAVDLAEEGDEIRVAGGTYSGVGSRDGLTQTIYLDKGIVLRGGYPPGDWQEPDPEANPTVLDARGDGRALYISGEASPAVEGFRITGGDASEMGGSPMGYDAGGGVYILGASATISGCEIYANQASASSGAVGGGLFAREASVRLIGNAFHDNAASAGSHNGEGGGLALYRSGALISRNSIVSNTASVGGDGWGGGLHLYDSRASLAFNTIRDNAASLDGYGRGGGLYVDQGKGVFYGNRILLNAASETAYGEGGGMYVSFGTIASSNDLVAANRAGKPGQGSGIHLYGAEGGFAHTTIANNRGGDGAGLYVEGTPQNPCQAALTNTIVFSQWIGIRVAEGCSVTLDITLWWANQTDWEGEGALTRSGDVYADPRFISGYHLGPASAALDRGAELGISSDFDGDPRPQGAAPDLGADEDG